VLVAINFSVISLLDMCEKSLKIPNRKSEAVNLRINNAMANVRIVK
jgi:hypothetical protein